jgi:hypothetical protein
MKARTSEEVSEERELIITLAVSLPGSVGVQEQTDDWPNCGLSIKKITFV